MTRINRSINPDTDLPKPTSHPRVRDRWHRLRVPVELADAPEKALTQQQFKDECDINRIVQNAMRGIPPRFMARGTPQYGDFSRVSTLTEAYQVIEQAEEAFMDLPAQLRLELGNDPRNINHLTEEQLRRYKLLKVDSSAASDTPEATSPAKTKSKRPEAGQASSPAGVPGED